MRIVTRPDFDGVVCAVLLMDAEAIDQPIHWIQPSTVQQGEADIRRGDIVANLPFDQRCSLWFDHHLTNRTAHPFSGAFGIEPSAARVIYNHYRARFSRDFTRLVRAADKIDAADLSMDEVLHPENYPDILLSMTVGEHGSDGEPYWNRLVELLGGSEIETVMADAQVKAQCRRVVAQNRRYRDLLSAHTVVHGHVSVSDFRSLLPAPDGNRFLVYSMFPDVVVSMKIRYDNADRDKVRISVGHSIFNRNCRVNVGRMLTAFRGGGHRAAGGCSLSQGEADARIAQMIEILLKNEPNDG